MPVIYGTDLILIDKRWTDLKVVTAAKNLVLQWEDEGDFYAIFGLDSRVAYRSNIWKQNFSPSPDYTQGQNDADLADFEGNFKASTNKPITPLLSDGVSPRRRPPRVVPRFTATTGLTQLHGT